VQRLSSEAKTRAMRLCRTWLTFVVTFHRRSSMRNATPSFESREYWDSRFTKSPESFDWLVSPSILIPPLLMTLSHDTLSSSSSPSILHIGCGTSSLSSLLRRHAKSSTILNVDFSRRAIELGIQREREEFADVGTGDVKESMLWATADLLNWQSIQSMFEGHHGENKPSASDYRELHGDSMPSTFSACNARFSIVIEKSCADAIACGGDIAIPIPYYLHQTVNHAKITHEVMYIHPVCLLAIHLAALTKPGGTWIVYSYSETRFDCLGNDEGGDENFYESKKLGAVPDPALLWVMTMKQEIISQAESMEGNVYRPKIAHWQYILRRTDRAITL
jgi:EEF1A lysine methyltransferase 4